jgi:serine-type D-Ala-D-Ala carboxypeptidase/endopeptidase
MIALRRAGAIPDREIAVPVSLVQAYQIARDVWRTGQFDSAPRAGNVALDKDLARRAREIAELKELVGECALSEPIAPVSAMEGKFHWACAKGKVIGRVQRSPTSKLELQVIEFGGMANE